VTPSLTPIQPVGHVDAGPVLVGSTAQPPPWSTAEQEKQRLYEQAQAAVRRIQGPNYSPPPETTTPPMSVGAALYLDATSSIRREPQNTQPHASPERNDTIPRYPPQTEKEMIKRYYDAKAAASRNQGQDYAQVEPISYDSLYPSSSPSNSGMSSQPPNLQRPPSFPTGQDDPPAFTSGSQHPILSEKERLRRHYEAQDGANSSASPPPISSPTPVYMPIPQPSQMISPHPQHVPITSPPRNSPPPPANNPPIPMNAFVEKEMLRKKYEAEDATRQAQNQHGRTPSRSGSALPPIPRSQGGTPGRPLTATEEKAQLAAHYSNSIPGSPPTPGRPLTAAEEKAQLTAQYEARDQVISPPVQPQQIQSPASAFSNVNPNNTLPTPPPLRPRPPVDYINRTKEEDTRTHSQYIDLDRVGSLASLRQQEKPDFSRQFSLNGRTTNGNGNGNTYGHES